MKVKVYRNLHQNCFSVVSLQSENYGKVIAHVKEIYLEDAEFVVSEKGRQRVIRENTKNVHAFVKGFWIRKARSLTRRVTYNPYKYKNFVFVDTQNPVKNAPFAELSIDDGVYI